MDRSTDSTPSDEDTMMEDEVEESFQGRAARKRKLPAHLNESVLDDRDTVTGIGTCMSTTTVYMHNERPRSTEPCMVIKTGVYSMLSW